jgi:excisionase family DNA binding protein
LEVLVQVAGLVVRLGTEVEMVVMAALIDSENLVDPMTLEIFRYVCRGTVNRWLREGRLKSIRVGRKFLTTRAWVEEFLTHEPKPAPPRERAKKPRPPKPQPVVEELVDAEATEAIREARAASILAAEASVLGGMAPMGNRGRKRSKK